MAKARIQSFQFIIKITFFYWESLKFQIQVDFEQIYIGHLR